MEDKKFYYSKGSFNSVSSFKSAVRNMSEKEVNGFLERGDFSLWLSKSLGENKISNDLRLIATKDQLIDYFSEDKKVKIQKNDEPTKMDKPKKNIKEEMKPKKTESKVENKPVSKAHQTKQTVSYVSSEAPHSFILKEFMFGALFGLMLGLILMAMLINSGIYY